MRRFLDLLKQEHDKQLQAHKDEYEQAFHECQQIKQQLNQSKQQIQDVNNQLSHVIQDRTKISVERDELLMRVNELTLRTRSSDEKLKDVEQRWAAKNAELMDKLEFQNQQLTGKRALWLSKNPESSARKDAMLGAIRSSQDPFNSPTANYTPGFEENRLTMMGSKSFTSPSSQLVPSTASSAPYPSNRGSKRRGGLPTGRAVPAPAPLDFQAGRASQRHITTEPGDDCTPSMALVLHNQENDVTAATFKALFHDLYYDFDLWVRKYTCKPSLQNDQAIPRSNQTLWQYILRMVSPYHTQDAHTHVVALLSDPRTRSWFVFRMLVSYCTINILNFEAFESFSPEVSKTLNECKEALKERGMCRSQKSDIALANFFL
jgi:hypothetical protein